MTRLDGAVRRAAQKAIKRVGKEGTIEYVATGGYNPSTGKASTSSTETTVRGVVENYSSREIDGTSVLRGDRKWTIAAKDIVRPSPNDVVDLGETTAEGNSVRETVISVQPQMSGDEAAMYVLQLRR